MTDLFDVDPISGRVKYEVRDVAREQAEYRRLARTSHPDTSHEAAKEVAGKLGGTSRFAFLWLRRYPGNTASELEYKATISDGRIRKRLNDLRLKGRAYKGEKRKCRVTGRMAYTWYPGND